MRLPGRRPTFREALGIVVFFPVIVALVTVKFTVDVLLAGFDYLTEK